MWLLDAPLLLDFRLKRFGDPLFQVGRIVGNGLDPRQLLILHHIALEKVKGLTEKPLENNWEPLLLLGLAQQRAGNVAAARAAYQELARKCQRELEKTALDSPPATNLHAGLGYAYAGLGDAASAIREGQKAMTIDPTSSDPFEGPAQEESMAEIYSMLGDADHAIPILKRLIKIPSFTQITPTLLRMNTIWDPIRNDPRFQELVNEKKR